MVFVSIAPTTQSPNTSMGKLDDNPSPPFDVELSDLSPGRDVPADVFVRDETFLEAFDGEQLFCQRWSPPDGPPSRGVVALMHGYGEHATRYDHVAAGLVRAGYGVMAIDARGHGRSTGKRAHVEAYDHYVRDFGRLVRAVQQQWPDQPTFCLGHSNGGLIVLHYAIDPATDITGCVVTSPMCGFALEVPTVQSWAGRLLSRVWPSFSFRSNLAPEELSHVREVVEQYEDDPLVQQHTTARWFTEAQHAQAEMLRRAPEVECPFLFVVSGDDSICSPDATESVFHRLGSADREMKVVPGAYHEVLNETNWHDVLQHVVDWMRDRT
jgi:alpha-beta hydrolase superfamily lysophospholipase